MTPIAIVTLVLLATVYFSSVENKNLFKNLNRLNLC